MLVRIESRLEGVPARVAISSSAGSAEVEWVGEAPVRVGEEVDVELDIATPLRWSGTGRLVGGGGVCSLRARVEAPAAADDTFVVRLGGEGIAAYAVAPGERVPSVGEELVIEQALVSAYPTGV
jgi:hypothetical protein